MIRLTPKQRSALQPTCASGTAKKASERSAKKVLRAFEGRYVRPDLLQALRRGAKVDVEPALRAHRVAALEVVEAPTLACVQAASIEALAVAECMFVRADPMATLTDVIVLARGVVDAVEVKRRSLAYALDAQGGWTHCVFAITRTREPRHGVRRWERLRHTVCAASQEDYAKARECALVGWDQRSAARNAPLAYAFPDEPWAETLLTSPGAVVSTVASNAAGSPHRVAELGFLLSACRDPALVQEMVEAPHGAFAVSQCAMELALALPPEDAVSIFAKALSAQLTQKHKTPPRDLVAAMAAIGSPSAAEQLAKYVGHRVVGALAAGFFRDRPEHQGALRDKSASAGARALAERLDEVDRFDEQDTPEATSSQIPALLRERAWRRPTRSPRRTVVPHVSLPQPLEEHVVRPPSLEEKELPLLAGARLDVWRAKVAKVRAGVDTTYDYTKRQAYRVPPDEGLTAWNAGRGWLSEGPLAFIARHGVDAVDGFARFHLGALEYEADEWVDALSRLHTPRAAPAWARMAARKRWRPVAQAWMCQHVELSALGLIPAAVGPKGQAQKDAEAALMHLCRVGHAPAIRDVAERYPDAVRAAVAALLARDPRVVDAKPPKAPPFLRPGELPPLRLAGARSTSGPRLAPETVDDLLELLSVAPVEYRGFEELHARFEPTSLDRFIWALVGQWAAADGPGRHDWMLRAAVALPGRLGTARVCQLARAWARSKQAPANRACLALASIGSDMALLHLGHIAATTRFKTLRVETEKRLNSVAAARGLTRDELEDRIVPDLGLDDRGRIEFRFGETSLVATLDGTLTVLLLDSEARRLRSFPRGRKDDTERKAAKARYDQLKKDVEAVAERQRRRLERAMVMGREWSLTDARRFFFEHPLGQHLARGLVWMARSQSFVVSEDRVFVDAQDEPIELSPDARVRIPHPVSLDDEGAWSRYFSDYELVQPFPQLGRTVHTPDEAERASGTILCVEGRTVSARKVLGVLESRGWRRAGGSFVSAFHRPVSVDVHVTMAVEPSFEIAYLSHALDVSLGAACVVCDGQAGSLEDLDAVAYSEIVHELQALV